MLIIHTALGELYQSFSSLELKQLDAHIRLLANERTQHLHYWLAKLKRENRLRDTDNEYLQRKFFKKDKSVYSTYTTYTNLLLQHIKEFLILSKIKEKNVHTEALWGEILFNRNSKKNLLLKLANFKLDIYRDSAAALYKISNYNREDFLYEYLTLSKRNYPLMIAKLSKHIDSFKDYYNGFVLELYYSLYSFYKQSNAEHYKIPQDIIALSDSLSNSSNDIIKILSLNLNLTLDKDQGNYYKLKDLYYQKNQLFSIETHIRIVPALLNYCIAKFNQGLETFNIEFHELCVFLYNNRLFHKNGIFTIIRAFNFIKFELQFGTVELASELLIKSLELTPSNQKESFQYLIESRIDFAKKNYRDALHKISIVDPKDSIYYYPQYKIMSIMCQVMMGDYDRLNMERDNFYKFIYNHKEVPEDAKRRHKLFIRYAEYLIEARFEHLSDYMCRRIENALLSTSPYFTEKEWVRERWNELKAKFGE